MQIINKSSSRLQLLAQRISSGIDSNIISSQINPRLLRQAIYGKAFNETMNQLYQIILQNKSLFTHLQVNYPGRNQERKYMTKQSFKINKLMSNIDYQHDVQRSLALIFASTTFSASLCVKAYGHFGLYTKALLCFADRKNKTQNQLLQKALKVQDIGCFGLTQFDHGSFTKGIQTEAVYDHNTKQFIITTLNQRAMKFWIGGAATNANTSVIVADLKVRGKSYGPHYFVVPIRDKNTYDVLPGVTAGDCGPKHGGNGLDNGFLMFNKVKIPKDYLLSKIGWVNNEGQYQSSFKSDSKRFGAHMSPLSLGRATVSIGSLANCTNSLSIAVRYAHNRRQFSNPINPNNKQMLLIDYPMTKYRLMPLLAQTIIYFLGGKQICKLYQQYSQQISNPQSPITNQLHAISAILKVKATWFAMNCITSCRQMMGGHGYSSFVRLGEIFFNTEIPVTLQGDNNLLLQQTSKYVLKAVMDGDGKIYNLRFVMNQEEISQQFFENCDINSFDVIQKILKDRIKTKFNKAFEKLQNLKQKGLKTMQIWNIAQPYFCNQMSLSYGDYFYFLKAKKQVECVPKTKQSQLMKKCLKLWIFATLQQENYGSYKFRKVLRQQIKNLCEFLSGVSLKLIEAISPPHWVTQSPFANPNLQQGMKTYINLLFSNPKTFEKVEWSDQLIKLRQKTSK